PFAKNQPVEKQSTSPLEAPVEVDSLSKEVIVANGDTLSTVFAKVGLPSNTVHAVLSSSKEAKQLSRLKIGQRLVFQLTEQGELASLLSPISKLENIQIEKSADGYVFK